MVVPIILCVDGLKNRGSVSNFSDDYYINLALYQAAIQLDNLENSNKGGPYCVKAEFARIYKERTGRELSLNEKKYVLDTE